MTHGQFDILMQAEQGDKGLAFRIQRNLIISTIYMKDTEIFRPGEMLKRTFM
jgi:hypothetical protein